MTMRRWLVMSAMTLALVMALSLQLACTRLVNPYYDSEYIHGVEQGEDGSLKLLVGREKDRYYDRINEHDHKRKLVEYVLEEWTASAAGVVAPGAAPVADARLSAYDDGIVELPTPLARDALLFVADKTLRLQVGTDAHDRRLIRAGRDAAFRSVDGDAVIVFTGDQAEIILMAAVRSPPGPPALGVVIRKDGFPKDAGGFHWFRRDPVNGECFLHYYGFPDEPKIFRIDATGAASVLWSGAFADLCLGIGNCAGSRCIVIQNGQKLRVIRISDHQTIAEREVQPALTGNAGVSCLWGKGIGDELRGFVAYNPFEFGRDGRGTWFLGLMRF